LGKLRKKDPVCAAKRVGLNCGSCELGYFAVGDNECEDCKEGGNASAFILVAIGTIFILGVFNVVTNKPRSPNAAKLEEMILGSVASSMSIFFLQSLGIFGRLRFKWPTAVVSVFVSSSIFLFNLDVLRMPCLMRDTFALSYIQRLVLPWFIAAGLGVVFLGAKIFSKVGVTYKDKNRRNSKLPLRLGSPTIWDQASYCQTMGQVINTLYITLAATVLSIFECQTNPYPNTVSVLRGYPSIVCGSAAHNDLMPAFCLGVLFYIIGIMALFAYMLKIAPKKFAAKDLVFQKTIRFLVHKYHPVRYWWSLVIVVRAFALSLVTVVAPDNAWHQFYLLQAVLVVSLVLQLRARPNNHHIANEVEGLELGLLVMLVALGAFFINPPADDTKTGDVLSGFIMAIFIVVAVIMFLAICVVIYFFLRPGESHRLKKKQAQDLEPRMRRVAETITETPHEVILSLFTRCSFIDIENLKAVIDFFDVELRGVLPGNLIQVRLPIQQSSIVASWTLERVSGSGRPGQVHV